MTETRLMGSLFWAFSAIILLGLSINKAGLGLGLMVFGGMGVLFLVGWFVIYIQERAHDY